MNGKLYQIGKSKVEFTKNYVIASLCVLRADTAELNAS